MLTRVVITRHGDRTPANVLPHENVSYACVATDAVTLRDPSISGAQPQ